MLGPYSVQRPVASYGSRGSSAGKCTSCAPVGGHLLADDLLDLGQHPQAQREPGVDAGGGAADVAGAHEQPVAGDLGVGRVLAQGADEQRGQAQEHGREPSGARGPSPDARRAAICAVRGRAPRWARARAARGRGARAVPARAGGRPRRDRGVEVGAISALKTFRPPPDGPRRAAPSSDVAAARQVARRHGRDADRRAAAPRLAPVARRAGCAGTTRCPTTPGAARAGRRSRCGCASTTAPGSTSPRRAPASGSPCTSSHDPARRAADRDARRRAAVRRVHRRTGSPSCSRRATSRSRACCGTSGTIAGHRQRLLRRDPARRPDEPVRA